MNLHRSLFALLVAGLLLACGGQATQTASAGAGGTRSATGGEVGSGGHTSGGSASGGTGAGGSGTVCCAAFPVCPTGERTANAAECPGAASCHQLSVCCSSIWCVSSNGSGGAGGAGAARDCNGTTCGATQACIAYRTEGGAVMFADAGTCPPGEHLEGSFCQRDFAYQCAELHGLCQSEPVTCSCAQPPTNNPGVCPAGYGSCSAPAPPADSAAQLICQQLVP